MKIEYDTESQIYISIIMPSLNVARYLRECIESVLSQTLQQIEILCIDGGSTDGTLDILKEYALRDRRIRIIKSDKKSYGYQIKLGILEARGDYIGIVETDDYIDASMYQVLYSYAEKNLYPDFVKGGYVRFVDHKKERIFFEYHRDHLADIFGRSIALKKEREKGILDLNHIWSGIYRRDLFSEKKICMHETPGASYQDLSFSLLVGLLSETGLYIEEKPYYYRMDNENSSVKSKEKWRCVIDEFEYAEQELAKKGLLTADTKEIITKQKWGIYFWNLTRLPEPEQRKFMSEIRGEIEEYFEGLNIDQDRDADSSCMAYLELLKDSRKLEEYFEKKNKVTEKLRRLLDKAETGEKFVLVSAGIYAERILLLQSLTGKRFIEAVADNDREKHGKIWNGYLVSGIPEAIKNFEKDRFIIANKNHSDTILLQLKELGIGEDRIFVYNSMLSVEDTIRISRKLD